MTVQPALAVSRCHVALSGRAIVRDVDMDVGEGEIVGLFGPSGAGKSTLFGAIAGELRLTSGTVLLGGVDVTRLPMWERARLGLGYVPQGPSVLFDLTVRENLRTFASLSGARIDIEERAREVELDRHLEVRAGSLSGGERRRLEIARALLSSPRILLCDEPFAGLGPLAARTIGSLLRARASDRGLAVLLSDHHVGDALSIADRAFLLVDGAIEVRRDAASFALDEAVVSAYVGQEGKAETSTEPRNFP